MLKSIPRVANADVLVGFDTSDDAGVYQITPTLALVQTVDFFTPIVDDPFTYGAIAAANALSDVYAMGGKPISALSILAWPATGDLDDLEEILKGGASKIHEAGAAILGGHSVVDDEIKFGYAVTGTVHPGRVLTNAGARAGDALVLTKALGTGVIATALKRGMARVEHVAASVESMLHLNRAACEEMLLYRVHGCTDVTGFGLLGHARELALASAVTLEIETDKLQFLPGALEYARAGTAPGGLTRNRVFVWPSIQVTRTLDPALETLLYDPQTSGGLLIAMDPEDARRMTSGFVIGRVIAQSGEAIHLV